MFAGFLRHRQLIVQMARRDVISRYRGSLIGLAWSFFNPVLMLAIYTFVFSTVFKARWGVAEEESRASFAVTLFVGVIIHGFLSECISKAPTLVLNNASYVKRVVFPLESLAWVAVGSALFHAFISLIVLVIAQLMLGHSLPLTAALFPLVLVPLVFVALGIGWLLAATAVYLRDIGMITGFINTALMFLSPVFYPLSALPEQFQPLVMLNPLTFVIEQGRKVLIVGDFPDWGGLAWYLGAAIVFAWLGYWWFQRSRNGFADVV